MFLTFYVSRSRKLRYFLKIRWKIQIWFYFQSRYICRILLNLLNFQSLFHGRIVNKLLLKALPIEFVCALNENLSELVMKSSWTYSIGLQTALHCNNFKSGFKVLWMSLVKKTVNGRKGWNFKFLKIFYEF